MIIKRIGILVFVPVLFVLAGSGCGKSLEQVVGENSSDGSLTGGIQEVESITDSAANRDAISNIDSEPVFASRTEETRKPPVTITVSAVGDCTLGMDDGFDYDDSFTAAFYEVDDPGWFLANVREYFAADDLTIVNFEGTLSERGEREEKTYAFRGDPDFVKVLTDGSVEAANLANNHSFDYGWDAYEDTKEILGNAGIANFGYDRSAVIEVNGIKVGLTGTLAVYDEEDARDGMVEQIEWVKSQGAQLVISSLHWGDEGEYYQADWQEYLGHEAVDAGADLVIGHHPHRLQPMEVYKGKHILYSLGNFCFGGNRYPSDMDSVIYQQTFIFEGGILQDDDDFRVIPCRISSSSEYNNYQPTPLEGKAAERALAKVYET